MQVSISKLPAASWDALLGAIDRFEESALGLAIGRNWAWLVFWGSLALGLVIRLQHVVAADFALNDGGMFYVMSREIQSANYSLPSETSYNHAGIPFVYPPLAFYLAALLDDVTGMSLATVFRVLPLASCVLSIGAFFLLARAILSTAAAVAIAVFAFSLLPGSYLWPIMGGGVARGPGYLFAILAIWAGYRMFEGGGLRYVALTAVFSALAILSHLETGWFVFFSLGVMFAFFGRSRLGILNSVAVVVGVLLLISPWLGLSLARHGIEPLLNAAQTGGHSAASWKWFLAWEFAGLPYLNWAAALALVGAAFCTAQGKCFLPLWLVLIMLLDPRAGPTYATVPLALLLAVGLEVILKHLLAPAQIAAIESLGPSEPPLRSRLSPAWPRIAAVALLLYVAALGVRGAFVDQALLHGVTPEAREAMTWVRQNVEPGSEFAVVTDSSSPWIDPVSEWFPALTGSRSIATPQGYEWFGQAAVDGQLEEYGQLQGCADADAACLEGWRERYSATFTHVYLEEACCPSLESSLATSGLYRLLLDSPGGSIYERR